MQQTKRQVTKLTPISDMQVNKEVGFRCSDVRLHAFTRASHDSVFISSSRDGRRYSFPPRLSVQEFEISLFVAGQSEML